ncbi:cation/H(+) antiporter 15-like [Actinidia eriantha]|uniref:cation/H(+) antiporter 15-like n=1 Tax=Actinidia eriantha TaxID=165200 RepID=UPI00258CC235|nr:cation/H(+) antiporter 15-like [Actinidia eriantha]
MDDSLANSLPLIAASQCLTAFPNIACLLAELKILNTDLGRLAISTSCFCDVMGISLMAVAFSIMETSNFLRSFCAILSTVAILATIVYVFRASSLTLGEIYITAIFIVVLVASLVSEIVSQHYILGLLVLGLAVPEGPLLGAALVAKLDSLFRGCSTLPSLLAVLLIAHYTDMPSLEALVLGRVLNARGFCEVAIYNLWKDGQILTDQEFAFVVISVVAVTAIITPLIRTHMIPQQEDHPTCEAQCGALSAKESPVASISSPTCRAHRPGLPDAHSPPPTLHRRAKCKCLQVRPYNQRIATIRALQQRLCHLRSFSAISQLETIHEDICRVAFDQNATIDTVFNWHLYRPGNFKWLVFHYQQSIRYHVAVLYIGSLDDAESLSYGARMVNRNNVTLTVIRFVLF